jgi:hypothetical protein
VPKKQQGESGVAFPGQPASGTYKMEQLVIARAIPSFTATSAMPNQIETKAAQSAGSEKGDHSVEISL